LEKQTLPAILAYICIGDSNLNNPTQRRSGRFTRKYPRKSTGYLQTEGSSWQVEHFVELQLLEHVARFEDHVLRFHRCKGTVRVLTVYVAVWLVGNSKSVTLWCRSATINPEGGIWFVSLSSVCDLWVNIGGHQSHTCRESGDAVLVKKWQLKLPKIKHKPFIINKLITN